MPTDKMIKRSNVEALSSIPRIVSEVVEGVVTQSKALQLLTRLPNMTTKQAKMSVLGMLPEAYWVNGDTGLKQTTNAMWKNKFITAEEIAVIVPIPEAVLDDSDYDIWGQIKPRIVEAFGKKIDQAIFVGKDKPASFREGLIPSIINAGASIPAGSDKLFIQISKAMGKVEQSGFDVTGLLGGTGLKQAFREGLVDNNGNPLQSSDVTNLTKMYSDNGSWDNTKAKFIVGDFKQAVYSIRQEITFKFLDQSVITDADGKVVLNLAQQDCVALRVVMRLGWEVPNPINAENPNEETRFPFALVEPATAPTTYTVTYTVKDDAGTPVAVEGVEVIMAGQVKKTNASGVATFKSLGASNYSYIVTGEGYKTTHGDVSITTSAVNVAVTLPKASK